MNEELGNKNARHCERSEAILENSKESPIKMVRLGDVATYINGYAFKPSDWKRNGLPIVRIQNLTGNDYETNYYDGEIAEKYHIKNGDVLISWSGSLGVFEWKKSDALLNQHIFKVVFDKINIDKKYFIFAASNLLSTMENQTHGSTMRHITKTDFDKIHFPLPPLQTQKQIAARLDLCTDTIAKHKKLLELHETLVKSQFVKMFGDNPIENGQWKIDNLGNLCDLITDGTHKTPVYQNFGIKFISARNIINGKIDLNDTKFITEDEYQQIQKRCKTEKNDVLLTKSGTLGNSAIVDFDIPVGLFESLAVIKYKRSKLNGIFLKTLLSMPFCQDEFKKGTKGITIKHLHLNVISTLQIPVPPLALQQKFATFVLQVEKSKSAVQASLQKAETLYKALMQKYFE